MPSASQAVIIYNSGQLSADVVLTGNVKDGELVNADFSASAAIAATKLQAFNIGVVGGPIPVGGITNTEIAAGAAIADSKLAQITTASKVSGAAITSLTSLPAGAGVIPAANLPSSGLVTATISITSAQFLQMNTTPVELIPDPGAGKINILISLLYEFTHVTTGYAVGGGNSLMPVYAGDTAAVWGGDATNGGQVPTAGITTAANIAYRLIAPGIATVVHTGKEHKAINFRATANPTTGDGTVKVYVSYLIHTL